MCPEYLVFWVGLLNIALETQLYMRIHFIAIGGSAMHNLALALHQMGHHVTGSDDQIFEPSRSRLAKAGLLPSDEGWFPNKIDQNVEAVILGMHARNDNPELERARELGIRIYSYPEFIYEQCKDKTRVVIAGSHGKTTITGMILHVLEYHDQLPDFMVGAQLEGFDTMVRLTEDSEFVVLEGDEYLSSPIDMRPKFLNYHPNIALLSGIAWDHINVFKTEEEYVHQFDLLLDSISNGGALIYNEEDDKVREVVARNTNTIKQFSYFTPEYQDSSEGCILDTFIGPLPLSIFGRHNMQNLEGARWICNQMGITDEMFYEAIPSFTGAANRLEKLAEGKGVTVFKDFAHAPSKVRATVDAVKGKSSDEKVIACLELHTFSSLQKAFLPQYQHTMQSADVAFVYFSPQAVAHKNLPELKTDEVKEAFGEGVEVFDDVHPLLKAISAEVSGSCDVLLMSSGNFGGTDIKQFAQGLCS
jgi:UDP-N-acetylmuramate: L-alanyl-gamma-D-glutamyl-meso-diaminopimelate ligase